MQETDKHNPILIELDEKSWVEQLNHVEQWLDNLYLIQSMLLQQTSDAVEQVKEPHIKHSLSDMEEYQKKHESKVEELYQLIGRKPANKRKTAGEISAKSYEAAGGLMDLLGGAAGPWRNIHHLMLTNMNALGAFAIAEQLGLALGIKEIPELTFPIIHEKQTHHLVLQEYMLELASISILYKDKIKLDSGKGIWEG